MGGEFQSLQGTIPTKLIRQKSTVDFYVSIPSRYDPNPYVGDAYVDGLIVSIPSRYDPNETDYRARKTTHAVSIPSRYDPNVFEPDDLFFCIVSFNPFKVRSQQLIRLRYWDRPRTCFNPFKVRSQPITSLRISCEAFSSFNPFKVRSQRRTTGIAPTEVSVVSIPSRYDPNGDIGKNSTSACNRFQSLQGTIPTRCGGCCLRSVSRVSIPSRYDPNTLFNPLYFLVFPRFNPFKVRSQPDALY